MHETLQRLSNTPLYRRLIALSLFLALLVGFRHLALTFVTFIILARGLGALGGYAAKLSGQSERRGVLAVLLIIVGLLSLGVWGSIHVGSKYVQQLQALRSGRPLAELFAQLQTDVLARLPSWIPIDDLKEKAPELLAPAMTYVQATGRTLLQLLIGLILAIIFLLDRAPVESLVRGISGDTIPGLLRRYFGFLFEAVVITITLQVLVALVNTLLTLPVLWLLGLPHKLGFTVLIFFSSLVPVVGNLVSGAVLITASYAYKGIGATIFFILSTFVLHKIEAYYLNPRLASRHVNLPSLVLIISLILFEHTFGLIGLFLSFPALYVGLNIWRDLRGASTEPMAMHAGSLASSSTPLPVPAPMESSSPVALGKSHSPASAKAGVSFSAKHKPSRKR